MLTSLLFLAQAAAPAVPAAPAAVPPAVPAAAPVAAAPSAGAENLTLSIIVIAVYILALGYLGFQGYRQTKTRTDYLLAGRNTHPWVMALSYGSTFISTSAIVGFGGFAAMFGMGILWLTFLNIFAGIFIAFVVFGKRVRKIGRQLDAHSFPELMGRRFQSNFIRYFSAIIIALIMPLYASAVLRGGAVFIQQTFGISLEIAVLIFALIVVAYVLAGGLKAVMLTDALQATIMIVGMFLLLVITYAKLGGVIEAHQALTDMAAKVPEKWAKGGHQGWTSMPKMMSPLWLTLVTSIVMGVGIGVLAQPQLAVRFMTVKSSRELNRAVLIGGIFILMMTGVAFTVGALSNVYFMQSAGEVAVFGTRSIDQVIPVYINAAFPGWFVVLFLMVLMSAAMSTLSSQFHTIGTSIGHDIYEHGIARDQSQTSGILVTRIAILIGFAVTLFLSLKLPTDSGVIARATAVFFGTCAAAFLPMFVGSLFSRRITTPAAIACMVVGFSAALVWGLLFHEKTASDIGLCAALTDGAKKFIELPGVWKAVDPLIIALPLSTIATIVMTFITKPLPAEHLDLCFDRKSDIPDGAAAAHS